MSPSGSLRSDESAPSSAESVAADVLRVPAGSEAESASELAPQPGATLHKTRDITSEALFLIPPV
jgi:hypothetical protein